MQNPQRETKLVAVVYDFFPHYRAGIMRALLDSPEYNFVMVGDRIDPDGSIKEWDAPTERFIYAPCVRLCGHLLWQKNLLRLAMRPDIHSIVFLGNAKWLSTWLAASLARFSGKRVLFWTHGWVRLEKGVKAFVRRCFYRLAHGLLLYGNWARLIGLAEGFPSNRLYVIYNSLDYGVQRRARASVTERELNSIRNDYCSSPNSALLIFCGRLIKSCKLNLLVEAMAILKRDGVETSLLLVGDGPEKGSLVQMAKELEVRVHFYGACYDENILARLIMSANVMVSPGKVGLTAMHGFVYGIPVISHDDAEAQGPEFEAIIHGKTGALFRRDDVSDLVAAIKKWVAFPWPNEEARRECNTMVERFYNADFQRTVINRAICGLPAEEPDTVLISQLPWYLKGLNCGNAN